MEILFNNYYDDELFEVVKQDYIEQGNYEEEDITDDFIFDEITFMKECEWVEIQNLFETELENSYGFLVCGACQRWDGIYEGGYIANNFSELLEITKDCDYIKIYQEDNHIFLECSHHDGTNCVEIKKLTEEGFNYYESNCYNTNDRILYEEIFNNINFSNLFDFSEWIF